MKFNFTYQNKTYYLDVTECKTLSSKFIGIMFQKNSPALLFIFKKTTQQSVHSFFCKPFIAIWFDRKNKIVDIKSVKPWKISIKPHKPFIKLLEIPENLPIYKILFDKMRKL